MAAERHATLAGLETTIVESGNPRELAVVLLHGYAMRPLDLAPFAHSIGVEGTFFVPRAPLATPNGGYAWWSIDEEARHRAIEAGPRDLASESPEGIVSARLRLAEFVAQTTATLGARRLVVGGFSQGGMLACDSVLHGALPSVAGLFLLSASRIAFDEWRPRREALRDLPTFVSHGRADADLSFAAGEALKDFAQNAGAHTVWVPFDSGHEIPLTVWRQLRKFIQSCT